MFLRIQTLSRKYLIGKKLTMSFTQNKTYELWRSFMPLRQQIRNAVGTDLYSMEVYPDDYFRDFDQSREFEKWAAVEVTVIDYVPEGMEVISTQGPYAVFLHKGPASEGALTYKYIFQEWLPASGYRLDTRPHFAVMGEKYRNNSPESEEEIWIPVLGFQD